MAADVVSYTLGSLVRHARRMLEEASRPEPALDARLLVEHFTATSRTDAITDPDREVQAGQVAAVLAALDRRLAGEPVHRIIGSRDFYGLKLKLSSETLEPRPDTETLVDLVLPLVKAAADRHGACTILDMGTGTGAIALALLSEEARSTALASDISADALATASANADMTGNTGRVTTVQSDWYQAIEGRFHIIVSNPPYIASREIDLLEREVRDHDPLAALDGGPDGLDPYRAIAAGARHHLQEDGHVAVEVGHDQADVVRAIFEKHGLVFVRSARDLGGHERALLFAV
ncbi:peptide chain release factor N(5)-glutamine methyltransferase [Mesorhizobium sp. CAU 1732]|uniref:peptide chain release factor N(5)-glutamine methyltransferase n=1 Tax=Mesorhizobium sp. CAU 1732 TaxID=3140358 RepID=UPI00325FFCAC